MTGFEPIIAGLSALVVSTVTETAKEESGSTLAKLLNKDIGKTLAQQVFNASGEYLKNYQERHGTLKLACVRMDAPMELDQLYTAVRLLKRSDLWAYESIEGLLTQYRESGQRSFSRRGVNQQDGIEVANQESFLMVLGGPGIGKSTLLRKIGLEALKQKAGSYAHACLPVFLPLQRFKTVDQTIEQRIAEELAICRFPEPEAVTAAMLKKGKLLMLLDGLDEVAVDLEDAVIQQIRDFVDRHHNNRFIVSCRVAAYKGGFPRFKDVAIAPFVDEQIKQFIRNWFGTTKDQENETAKQCWQLLQRSDYAATKNLAETPLLLTLLCAVFDKQLDFPKNRASLYAHALDVVLKEWAAEKRIHSDPIYRDLSIELERELLAELAFDSFVDDQLFFEKRDVTCRIREFLVSNLNAPNHLNSEAVLEAIEVQQGILTERARDTYSFSHLTFQEYLTAQYIVANQQVEWLVENHTTDQQWREIFFLVAGLMPGRKGADDLLKALAQRSSRYLNSPTIESLVQWADAATNKSTNLSKPAAKRVGVIFLAITIAIAIARDLAIGLARDRDRSLALARDLAIGLDLDLANGGGRDLAHDRALAIDLARARARDRAHILAQQIQSSQIFNFFNNSELNEILRQLKQKIDSEEIDNRLGEDVADALFQSWSKAFQFDLKLLAYLDNEERTALENYLYSCELMVRCKEAAVRVSPEVWQGIEERMVTVPQEG